MVLQFFKDNNLINSLNTLADETGVYYSEMSNSKDLIENVKKGSWHLVLKALQTARLDKRMIQRIYEQVAKELILEKEQELVINLLKEWSVALSEPVVDEHGSLIIGEGHLLQELWDLT